MAQAPAPFEDSGITTKIEPAVQQNSPVVNNSGAYLADAVKQGIGDATSIFGMYNTLNNNKVLTDYREQVLQVADAAQQGLNPNAANMRVRAIYRQFIANNPNLADQIDSVNSKILSDTGLAHVAVVGNNLSQAQQALEKEAIGKGWQNPDGTANVAGYQNFQRQMDNLDYTTKQITAKTGQIGLATDMNKYKGMQALNGIAAAGIPWLQAQFGIADKALQSGADPAATLQTLKTNVSTELGMFSAAGNGLDTSYITKPMQDMLQNYIDGVNKKESTDVINAQLANDQAKVELSIYSDPTVAKVVAVNKLLGGNATDLLKAAAAPVVAKLFADNAATYDPNSKDNPTPANVVNTSGDTQKYLDFVTQSMDKAFTSGNQANVTQDVATQLTNVLRSVGSTASDNTKDYVAVVNFFGSPSVSRWVGVGKAVVPKDVADKATNALQQYYGDFLLPTIDQMWNSGGVMVNPPFGSNIKGGNLSFADVLQPVWDGNNLTFQPKPEYAKIPAVIGAAKAANSGRGALAPAINNFIRAKANMSGSADYNKAYQDIEQRLFNPQEEVKSDQKTLQDFQNGDIAAQTSPTGMEGYLNSVRKAESNNNDNNVNPVSGATGRYQFLPSTWRGLVNAHPNSGLTMSGISDPAQQEVAMRLFTQENSSYLTRHDIPITPGNLYAAHLLGPGGAVPVLSAKDSDALSDHVRPAVIAENPVLTGMTIGEFKQWAESKFSKG